MDFSITLSNTDIVMLFFAIALIFLMQAGFALLEAGSCRSKNTVNVIMKNFTDTAAGAIIFYIIGYGLMFGTNSTGWFGTDHFLPSTQNPNEILMLLFQMMFASTAATIISGAIAERAKFFVYIALATFITGFVYPIFGSWSWGGYYGTDGWLKQMGFIDFAGSTVVHSIGAWGALAAIIILKPRLGKFSKDGVARNIPGHNLSLVALGAFLLWFGWFGFNGGSIVNVDAKIGTILLNTHLAASAGAVAGLAFMALFRLPILLTHTVNATLGGLVGVTAGCATMSPTFAILTGAIAGIIVILGTYMLEKMRLDDVVGAIPVHGFAGTWGTLAAGLFLEGNMFNPSIIFTQLVGIGAAFVWAFGATFIFIKIIDIFITSIRVPTIDEQKGLDFTEHYEVGYPEFQENQLHEGKE